MSDYNSRHQRWYDAYKALAITEGLIRHVTPDDDPAAKEICNLLDVAQHLAESRTIIVQDDTIDASLVDPDDTLDADDLTELFDTLQD